MSASVVSGLNEVVAELDRAQSRMMPGVRAVVERGALNIKQDAARRASGLKHAPAYPQSISYDVHNTFGGVTAEIGPDKGRRQGALGNILEFGTPNNAPRPHLNPALDVEEPKFVAALDALLARLLP